MAVVPAPDVARALRAETILAVAIGLVSLIVIAAGALLWAAESQHRNENDIVESVRASRNDLMLAAQAMSDAELIAAWYEATNSQDLLVQLYGAEAEARVHLAALRETLGSDPTAGPLVANLSRAADERFAVIKSDLSRRGAPSLRQASATYSVMRTESANLYRYLNQRIDDARANEDDTRRLLNTLTIALSLFSLVGSGLAMFALRRERTQWQLAHAAAEEARERAAASERAKSRFLAVASHDMRQPLHALSLYLTALERRVQTDEAREIVAKMDRAVQSMVGMFSSLLDLARLQAGVIEPEITETALQPIFDAIAAEHPGSQVEITPTDLAVWSDPRLLERVMSNLAANAVKHGGSVRIWARRDGETAEIVVADEGPGIPLEDQERIFNEFERLGAHHDGLGLGLTIVRRVTAMLDIDMRLDSAPGEGARFTLCLPLAATQQAAAPLQSADDALRGVDVLAMDDDPLAREAVAGLLRDLGANVRACANGVEAMAAIKDGFRPTLLVLDLRIDGELAGLGIATELRAALSPPPPVIMITGDTEPSTLEALRASGHAWLIKPIDPNDLSTAAAALAPFTAT